MRAASSENPRDAAAVLDDDRAFRLQCLKRRGNRAQLSGQLAHAQLPSAQRFHDRDLLDGVRTRCELGNAGPATTQRSSTWPTAGCSSAPTAVAPVHHARHAARRREQAHARRQRRDIAFGKPLGARCALLVEIRLADGALDGLELARVDALRPLRPARLPIFADRHHKAHGAPVTERHQHRATHRNGEVAPKRAVVAISGTFACGGEQPLFRDCIGIRRIERLRRYVQDHRCQFHSAPVYQRFAYNNRKGEQIYAFCESVANARPLSPSTLGADRRCGHMKATAIRRPAHPHNERPRTGTRSMLEKQKARRQAPGATRNPQTAPRSLPAGFPYFEISSHPLLSAANASFDPALSHPQPASQPARVDRSAPFCRRRRKRLLQTAGPAQGVRAVGCLPGELGKLAAEVAVGGQSCGRWDGAGPASSMMAAGRRSNTSSHRALDSRPSGTALGAEACRP